MIEEGVNPIEVVAKLLGICLIGIVWCDEADLEEHRLLGLFSVVLGIVEMAFDAFECGICPVFIVDHNLGSANTCKLSASPCPRCASQRSDGTATCGSPSIVARPTKSNRACG